MLLAVDVPVIEIADIPPRRIEHAVGLSNFEVGMREDPVVRFAVPPVGYDHGIGVVPLQLERDVEAVFAASDLCAVGIVTGCQRRGIDMPGRCP